MKLLFNVFAVVVSFVLFGAVPNLYGQEFPLSSEAINLKEYPVEFNKDLGVFTARIGEGRLHQIDATLIEIPSGGQLAPHRHLAEEIIYVVSGKGYTTMWNQAVERKERYNLVEGDLLSPSMNAWHQHFNSSSDIPGRYLSLTTTPLTGIFSEVLLFSPAATLFSMIVGNKESRNNLNIILREDSKVLKLFGCAWVIISLIYRAEK